MHDQEMIAFDTFAGVGWGVACHWLGIREKGAELMPEAVATRDAVGFETIYRDVWDGILDPAKVPAHDLKISSPPCQTFSTAGKGDGRRALADVLSAIRAGVYQRPLDLYELTKTLDPRTALVLTPLAHIYRERPRLVALEQVPSVLPVWEAFARVMREWGYSVAVGVLSSEMYGVPQTRKRAILVARRDGREARLPTPTHSRYYSTDPKRLDPGVLPWVSMAEALGSERRPEVEAWKWLHAPATTIAGDPRITAREHHHHGEQSKTSLRLELDEATILQSFPRGLIDRPAPTITGGGTETGGAEPIAKLARYTGSDSWVGDTRRLSVDEAATLQSFPAWGFTERPALTVTGHGLLTRHPTGQKKAVADALEAGTFAPRPPFDLESARKSGPQREDYLSLSDRYEPGAVNATPEENAALQTFPQGFPFQGTRGKQFLQVGNAVPPLMAAAILAELIAPPEPLDQWQTAFLGSTADHLVA